MGRMNAQHRIRTVLSNMVLKLTVNHRITCLKNIRTVLQVVRLWNQRDFIILLQALHYKEQKRHVKLGATPHQKTLQGVNIVISLPLMYLT